MVKYAVARSRIQSEDLADWRTAERAVGQIERRTARAKTEVAAGKDGVGLGRVETESTFFS